MTAKLGPDDLSKSCNPEEFNFATTEDVVTQIGIIGQEKALRSLDFGLDINAKGFQHLCPRRNGHGKNDHRHDDAPGEGARASRFLPTGATSTTSRTPICPWPFPWSREGAGCSKGYGRSDQGAQVGHTQSLRIERVREAEEPNSGGIPAQAERAFLEAGGRGKGEGIFHQEGRLRHHDRSLERGQAEPLTPEEFGKLDEKTKKEMEKAGRLLQERLNEVFRAMRDTEKFVQEMLNKLERAIAFDALHTPIENLKNKYKGNDKIVAYLDDVREDILSHLDEFKAQEGAALAPAFPQDAEAGGLLRQVHRST